jgi:hypothetical protein
LIGDVAPDNEYQTREDKAADRPVRQKTNQVTGKRQWKATVTDPDEPTAKPASFEITLIAEVQPVPTTAEVLPGMRPSSSTDRRRNPESPATANSSISPTSTGQPGSSRRPVLPGLGHHRRSSQAVWPGAVSSPARPRESRDGPQRGHAGSEVLAGRVFGPPGRSLTHRSTV